MQHGIKRPVPLHHDLKVYLGALTQEQGDRVLTSKLISGTYLLPGPRRFFGLLRGEPQRCLIAAVQNYRTSADVGRDDHRWRYAQVISKYDQLCNRYGLEATTASIRQYILDLRAHDKLAPPPQIHLEPEPVGALGDPEE